MSGSKRVMLKNDNSAEEEDEGESIQSDSDESSSAEYEGNVVEHASASENASGAGPASVAKSEDNLPESGEENEALGLHSLETLDENIDLPDFVKEHANTLTFPEKLMLALTHVEKECAKSGKKPEKHCIGWVLNGKAFVIRDKDKLCVTLLPLFFGQAKFSSFTRKLYRWGFRKMNMGPQYNGLSTAHSFFFSNENFRRDDKKLLSNMKSVTAAKTRSEMAASSTRQPMQASPNDAFSSSQQGNIQLPLQGPQQLGQSIGVPQLPMLASEAIAGASSPTSGTDNLNAFQQAINLAMFQSFGSMSQGGNLIQQAAEAATGNMPSIPSFPGQINQANSILNQIPGAGTNNTSDAANQVLHALRQLLVPQQAPQPPPIDLQQLLQQLPTVLPGSALTQNQPNQYLSAANQPTIHVPPQIQLPDPSQARPIVLSVENQHRLIEIINMLLRMVQQGQSSQSRQP